MSDDDRPQWLVWRQLHDRAYATIYYGALPESHDGRRGIIGEPIPLVGIDRKLSLDELRAKYRAPKIGK